MIFTGDFREMMTRYEASGISLSSMMENMKCIVENYKGEETVVSFYENWTKRLDIELAEAFTNTLAFARDKQLPGLVKAAEEGLEYTRSRGVNE
jgi:hypothetical protein